MNNLKLTDFIQIRNLIPPETCKKIIQETLNDHWQKHTWYHPDLGEGHSIDNDELDVSYPQPAVSNLLFDYVLQGFKEYGTICEMLSRETNFSQTIGQCCGVRLNRYTVNTHMKPHFDHIHSLFDGDRKGIPVLSMIGVLNDDYEGGELTFFDDHVINTRAGDIIIFPSCFLYPHQIKKITSGTRYSFVSWGW